MALTRHQHWATRSLNQHLIDTSKVSFQWGVSDCCLFPANAIQAFTGVDIADDFRGKYTDEASAFALIKTVTGGTTVADAAAHCATKHGLVELAHPLCAQRGDLVVMQPVNTSPTLIAGIVHLNGRHLVTVGESGLMRLPITCVKRAWRV